MKYAPITSVGVERSLSIYKNILALNKMSSNENNLTKCIWSYIRLLMYNLNFILLF